MTKTIEEKVAQLNKEEKEILELFDDGLTKDVIKRIINQYKDVLKNLSDR